MPGVARLGDPSNHGGSIITASSNVFINGKGVARHGDLHSCPLEGHGVTAMNSSATTKVNGQPVVRIGIDYAGCGAVIVSGSPNTNAG